MMAQAHRESPLATTTAVLTSTLHSGFDRLNDRLHAPQVGREDARFAAQ
jgi:hypothetical protein